MVWLLIWIRVAYICRWKIIKIIIIFEGESFRNLWGMGVVERDKSEFHYKSRVDG